MKHGCRVENHCELVCCNCGKTGWSWSMANDGPPTRQTPNGPDDVNIDWNIENWLAPGDCPYCGAIWDPDEEQLIEIADWIMSTNTEIVCG